MYNDLTKGNLFTILISVLATFLSYVCVVFLFPMIADEQLKLFLSTIVSTIGAAFLVNVLWEIFAKKRFADSIFEVAKISQNIEKSGVDRIDTDFSAIDWKAELSHTHNFTAIFTYAQTWRNSNRVAIRQYTRKRRNKFTVIMPDYENNEIMAEFDRRYHYASGKTRELIREAILDYVDMGANVYLCDISLQATYYVMDNIAFMAFFKHSPGKATVPYIRAESSGSVYKYILTEKNAILNVSKKVYITNGTNGNKIINREEQKDGTPAFH